MARTDIPVTDQPFQGSTEFGYTAADATNDMKFANDGKTVLVVKNGSGGAVQVTVQSVADEAGREGDEVRSVSAGAEAVFGPFRKSWWNQKTANIGEVHVDLDADTSIEVAALSLEL